MTSTIHLGLTPWQSLERVDVPHQAAAAESMGYESFWLPESHFLERGAVPAPLLSLAAAAAVTTTLKLGTVSLLLPIRDPLLMAEEVAVLDRLSGGRVLLGVGRGFRPALFRAFGVPVQEKRDRFEVNLAKMIDAWRGGDVGGREDQTTASSGGGAAGDEVGRPEEVRLAPRPAQSPHPPVWVAAFGPKALAQAARLRLPYLASPLEPLDTLTENYAEHLRLMKEKKREQDGEAPRHRPASFSDQLPKEVPIMRTAFVSDDAAEVEEARRLMTEEARGIARARSGRLRRAAESPLEERALIGDPMEVREGISRYRERLSMTHMIVRSPIGLPADVAERSLRRLREIVVR